MKMMEILACQYVITIFNPSNLYGIIYSNQEEESKKHCHQVE